MEAISKTIGKESEGQRLDQLLVAAGASLSRAEIQRQIRDGCATINGRVILQPSYRLRLGQVLVWHPKAAAVLTPQPLALDIVYEDSDLVAVNKPAGLVVHPGAGTSGVPTLVEALLATRDLPSSDDPARPGVVHRIDKETTGVMVVAKTDRAMTSLKRQFADRSVEKLYLAVVAGTLDESEGSIDAPVGRDLRRPRRMSVRLEGRPARTEFRVLARQPGRAILLVRPRTGRTHQIRVHLKYIGHPIVGDALYGGPPNAGLLLHSWRLTIDQPATGERLTLEAPPPDAFPPEAYEGCLPSDNAAMR